MNDDTDICSICYEPLNSDNINNSTYKLECNHTYHTDCILKWFRNKHSNCPLCNDVQLPTLTYFQKIETLKEARKISKKKSCPLNLKKIFSKLDKQNTNYKEAIKLYNLYKKNHKTIFQELRKLAKKKHKIYRNMTQLENQILCNLIINPIYIKK